MKICMTCHLLSCVSVFRSRTQGPIGPGKYGYGKAPYILPLQSDTTHTPERLQRQRPASRPSRSQGTSAASHGYNMPAHQLPHHGPLYQSESGPRSGQQALEASIYQLPLTHDQGFPAASSLFHSPEASSSHDVGAHRGDQSFSQPLRSAAISCIGAYRQYKLCNTNVSTCQPRLGVETAGLFAFCLVGPEQVEDRAGGQWMEPVNRLLYSAVMQIFKISFHVFALYAFSPVYFTFL